MRPITDSQGQRQARQQGFVPRVGPADLLSDDALKYTDAVPGMQAAATRDPYLNGADAARRLHTDE